MCWAAVIAATGLAAFMVWASADVGSGVYLKTLCRRRIGRKVVAITFDDGPDEVMTPKILDILRRFGVRATFFMIGEKVGRNPSLAKRIADEGHSVGSHTFSHSPMLALRSRRRVDEDIAAAVDAVERATGRRPKLFRPPFGVTNPVIGRAVRAAGLTAVGWSIRSLDTLGWRDRSDVASRVARQLHDGAVILLHDRCKDADKLLEAVLTAVREGGYETATIDELFETDCYEK